MASGRRSRYRNTGKHLTYKSSRISLNFIPFTLFFTLDLEFRIKEQSHRRFKASAYFFHEMAVTKLGRRLEMTTLLLNFVRRSYTLNFSRRQAEEGGSVLPSTPTSTAGNYNFTQLIGVDRGLFCFHSRSLPRSARGRRNHDGCSSNNGVNRYKKCRSGLALYRIARSRRRCASLSLLKDLRSLPHTFTATCGGFVAKVRRP